MSTKKLDEVGLSQLWSLILSNFTAKQTGKGLSTNDLTDELLKKLNNVSVDGEANVIESISVNGVVLSVSDKGVNIEIPKGTLASLDEVEQENLSATLLAVINGKATKATSLSGYGIEDAYTKDETDAAINAKVAGVYKVQGSVAFADLASQVQKEGYVYNITDDFTADKTFLEKEQGKKYPAGTNVVYTALGWDCMAGTYDFSNYMMKDDITNITTEEINTICVMPTI